MALSLLFMILNAWGAWLLSSLKTELERDNKKVPWYVVPLGAGNVLLCIIHLLDVLKAF